MDLKDFKALQKGCVFLNEFKRKMAKLDKGHKLLTMTLNNVSRTASRINARVTELSKKMYKALDDEQRARMSLRDYVMSRIGSNDSELMRVDGRLDEVVKSLDGVKDTKANKADLVELASEMAHHQKRLNAVEARVLGMESENISQTPNSFLCAKCGYYTTADPGALKHWHFCPRCGSPLSEGK